MNFYNFNQNNSGGYYQDLTVGGVTAHHFWVAADNAADANKIFSITVGFDHSFCPCCGERFSEKWDDEKPDFTGSIDDLIAHQRNREFFSGFNKNAAIILDPLGKNVFKIDPNPGKFSIGDFRKPTTALEDETPKEKPYYFMDGKLYEWDWDYTKTQVIAEVDSAVAAVKFLEEREYVPGKYNQNFERLSYSASKYDGDPDRYDSW